MSDRVFMREEIRDALRMIVAHRAQKALNWAIGYAEYGINMIDNGCSDYDLETQLLYVIGNISRWRGSEAKETREILKKALKALRK